MASKSPERPLRSHMLRTGMSALRRESGGSLLRISAVTTLRHAAAGPVSVARTAHSLDLLPGRLFDFLGVCGPVRELRGVPAQETANSGPGGILCSDMSGISGDGAAD